MKAGRKILVLVAFLAVILTGCDFIVGNFVWDDTNQNGTQDPGETGIPGVTVVLYKLIAGSFVAGPSTTTDAAGMYSFDIARDNEEFLMEFLLPPGYIFSPQNIGSDISDSDPDASTGRSPSFFVPSSPPVGEGDTTFDAGMYLEPLEGEVERFTLGNFVWNDLNGNGIQDENEEGVEGVEVLLSEVDLPGSSSATTNASGFYEFVDLLPGDYQLHFIAPGGFDFTLQDQGSDDGSDSDPEPASGLTAEFTLVGGDDFDQDAGLIEQEEAGSGVPVVYGPNPEDFPDDINPLTGMPYCEALAKDWGVVGMSFSLFPAPLTRPPTWLSWAAYVTEWWIGDGDSRIFAYFYGCYPDVLIDFGDDSDVDFTPPPSEGEIDFYWIGDRVWHDMNGDGLQDAGEPGIPGIKVDLTSPSGTVLQTTTTGLGGLYWFGFVGSPGDQFRVDFQLTNLGPYGTLFSPRDVGNDDTIDSDANPASGQTSVRTIPAAGQNITDIDAGIQIFTASDEQRSDRFWVAKAGKFFSACTVSAGYDPEFTNLINSCGQVADDGTGNTGISGDKLKELAMQNVGQYGPPNLTGNMFTDLPPEGGAPAQGIEVYWNINNISRWSYDPAGVYRRSQNSPEHPENYPETVERLTGDPLGFENVIVLFVPHTQLNEGGTVFDIDIDFATGPAKVFRDGMVYEVQWSTVSGPYEQETGRTRPIRIQNLDGTPFPLKPGQQWVYYVHTATNFTMPEAGMWRVRWYAPIFTP